MRHRRLALLLALASPLLAAACASIIGFPDVPNVEDSGASNGSGSGSDSGSEPTNAFGSGSGDGSAGGSTGVTKQTGPTSSPTHRRTWVSRMAVWVVRGPVRRAHPTLISCPTATAWAEPPPHSRERRTPHIA